MSPRTHDRRTSSFAVNDQRKCSLCRRVPCTSPGKRPCAVVCLPPPSLFVRFDGFSVIPKTVVRSIGRSSSERFLHIREPSQNNAITHIRIFRRYARIRFADGFRESHIAYAKAAKGPFINDRVFRVVFGETVYAFEGNF